MKKKILTLLLTASLLTAMSGCVGSVVYLDENGNATNPPAQSTAESSAAPAASEDESSEEESSEEESSEEESSEEESKTEESSEEESKTDESSAEASDGLKITFTKPEKWDDDVCAYVFGDGDVKNAEWPGEPMTNNGGGTFSYTVPSDIPNPKVVFNYKEGKRQYPRSGGLDVTDGGTYTAE